MESSKQELNKINKVTVKFLDDTITEITCDPKDEIITVRFESMQAYVHVRDKEDLGCLLKVHTFPYANYKEIIQH